MSMPRYAEADITYNGTRIKTELDDYGKSFSYSDPASGDGDTIAIEMADPDDLWIGPWRPTQGDTLTGSISVYNWEREGDTRKLDCGSFTFDEQSGQISTESGVSLGGISQPASKGFKATQNSKNWENVTIQQIAQDIASRAGLALIYDADSITIESLEQSKQDDSKFLGDLCQEYGLSYKLYNNRIVIFDREQYKQRPTVHTFMRENVKSFSYSVKLEGTYTGGEIVYTDGDKEEEVQFRLGGGKRILQLNEKVDSGADAERKLRCAINEANHDMTTITITAMGNPDIVASQTVMVQGYGFLDGKYYINKVDHAVTGPDYTCSYSLSKIVPSI